MRDNLIKIDNFPCYMLCYCEYGSKEGIEEEDLRNYKQWLRDNQLEYVYCETDDPISYVTSPAFGKSCSVTTAYFKEIEKTRVIFRKEKDGFNDILAVFPDLNERENCMTPCKTCYSHCGQHSVVCRGYYQKQTVPAAPEEYQELKKELENCCGYNLEVVTRCHWLNK